MRSASLLAAEFLDAKNGLLGGAWSRLANLRDSGVGKVDIDTLGGRAIHGIANLPRRG